MGSANELRDLLRPLRIYDLTAESLSGAELEALGAGLDGLKACLARAEREGCLATAADEGLARWESLFSRAAVSSSADLRREAVAALLRAGRGCPTLASVNDAVSGCGLRAVVRETGETGRVQVCFPDVRGVPEDFERLREIVLDLLPVHLDVTFLFDFTTWAGIHAAGWTWESIHAAAYTWDGLQLALEPV